MKKLMSLLLVLVACLCLTACNEDPVEQTKEETKEETKEPTKQPTKEPTKQPTKVETPVPEVNYHLGELKKGAEVITYCAWGLGTEEEFNMTRRLVAKFNYEHDDVQIQLVEPEGDYDTFLTTKAAAGELPDVFMVNSVPKAVINYLAADITDLVTADSEWATVDPALSDSITYEVKVDSKGTLAKKVYAIPAGQYYMGFFANYTLLDRYVPGDDDVASEYFAPGAKTFTTDNFISTVKKMKKVDGITDGTGIVGLNATGDMINWLPGALDTTGNIQHFVWNKGTKRFDYRSEIMYDALRKIADLGSVNGQYTFDSVAGTGEAENVFGTGSAIEAFMSGHIGFVQSGTWENFTDARGFNVHFVGYPGGRVISASDYMCISATITNKKHKELAFEVAKYLTYGTEGYQARFDIVDAERATDPKTTLSITGLPVVNNEEIAAKWFEYVQLDGVQEVYNKVAAGKMTLIVEGNKSIPGFQDARFQASTGLFYQDVRGGATLKIGDYIWDVCSGAIPVGTYINDISAAIADKVLNQYVVDAQEQIKEVELNR